MARLIHHAAMPHLDEPTALAWVAGGLHGDALDAAVAHVDACAECRFLVAAAAGAAGPEPRTIGRFVVDGVAGRGAMGIVYRGRDPRLERPVAIKTLRGDAFDAPARARFEREARALARIDDPNVVRVYEVGELDGELYLAMELVDGATLEAWLAAAPRRAAEIVAVFLQAAAGLLAAHQVGLVHRDFKPSNAMIDADGRVRVTDFGLVHLDTAAPLPASMTSDALAPELTQTGVVLGTPAYLAPELFDGRADEADGPEPRSDQFSWCVALYEALAGHRPFEAVDLRGLRAAIDRGPVPPRRPIPRRVHRALRRGLAVSPRDRFPSMRELIDAVAPPSRARVVVGAAIGVTVLTAGAFAYAATREGPPPRPVASVGCPAAETRWAAVWNDSRKAALRAAVIDGWPAKPPPDLNPKLASRWEGLGRVQATFAADGVRRFGETWRSLYLDVCTTATHEAILRRACLDDAVGRLDAIVADPPRRGWNDRLRELEAERDRCTTHLLVGLDRPADEAQAIVDRARQDLAAASALRLRGDLATATAAIDRAIDAGTRAGSPSLLAEAWLERGLARRDAADVAASLDAWHTALAFAQQVSHHRVLRRAADELAAQYALGAADPAEAERWLRTAEALDGKIPPTDPERATRLLVRAELARTAGDLASARRLLAEARALARDPFSALTARIDRAIAAIAPPP